MSREGMEFPARGPVPHRDGTISRVQDNTLPVGAKHCGLDIIAMPGKGKEFPARFCIPNLDGSDGITTPHPHNNTGSRDNASPIGAKRYGASIIAMPGKGKEFPARFCIPNLDVIATGIPRKP
jgi:hypothetical protein